MSKPMKILIAPTLEAPTAYIKRVSDVDCDFKKCEVTAHVGLFFDGTNNNGDRDKGTLAHTNIARLSYAYKERTEQGCFPVYVPGVGTRFPEIGEREERSAGAGFASGCESRVIYGLLAVFNSLHRRAFLGMPFFSLGQIKALCRNNARVDSDDLPALEALNASCGLLRPDLIGDGERQAFLQRKAGELEAKLLKSKPRVVGCFVDVFGFSRGAAEARVFCNWLDQLLVGGKLAGVRLRIRFVGLMDTVASAGYLSSAAALATNSTGGHSGWASAEFLRIPRSVENCVHMVAMHELRRNFPLDEIGVDGIVPAGCQQYAYPGSHSDVGGGYAPGQLGISAGKSAADGDALKLSQIPLKHMLECAIAAGAPMTKFNVGLGSYDPFAVAPELTKAFTAFLEMSTLAARPLHAWLQPYLTWRWQVRATHGHLNQMRLANAADREMLADHNNRLIADADLMRRTEMSNGKRVLAVAFNIGGARIDNMRLAYLDPEARQVFANAQKAPATPHVIASFFDSYVHDSLAGFNKPTIEPTGYWRYRKGFLGDDNSMVVSNDRGEARPESPQTAPV